MPNISQLIADSTLKLKCAYLSDDFVHNLKIHDKNGDLKLFHKILWDYLPDSEPIVQEKLAKQISIAVRHFGADIVLGLESSGIGLAALSSVYSKSKFGFIRKQRKDYGLQNLVEGHFGKKNKVVIVDNFLFTGGSAVRAINVVKKSGFVIKGVIFADSFKNLPKVKELSNYPNKTIVDNTKKIEYLIKKEYFPNKLNHYVSLYVNTPAAFFENSPVYNDYKKQLNNYKNIDIIKIHKSNRESISRISVIKKLFGKK